MTFRVRDFYRAGTETRPYTLRIRDTPQISSLLCRALKIGLAPFYEAIGGLREDFAAEMLRMNDMAFYYLKTKRGAKTPDFLVKRDNDDIVIEIGGKGKGREQFKVPGIWCQANFSFRNRTVPVSIVVKIFFRLTGLSPKTY